MLFPRVVLVPFDHSKIKSQAFAWFLKRFFFRKKRKRLTEKVIHKQIRSLVPESQAYIELLRLEQKLDTVLMRKRLDIQETLKRPQKVTKNKINQTDSFFPNCRLKRNYESSSVINILFVSIPIQQVLMMNKFNIGKCLWKVVYSTM